MAHGVSPVLRKSEGKGGIGSRRIFAPHFKLQVLDSYRSDADCKGNQRATARKYGIHRRQIQKWLQVENNLRSTVSVAKQRDSPPPPQLPPRPCPCPRPDSPPLDLSFKRNGNGSAPVTPQPPTITMTNKSDPPCLPCPAQSPPSLAATPIPTPTRTEQQQQPNPLPVLLPMSMSMPMPSPGPGVQLPIPMPRPNPDVWDLSTKRPRPRPRPVKLFKPYLDDVGIGTCTTSIKQPPLPCCDPHYNNNNNDTGYTLHELQPSYYYHPYAPTYHPPEYDLPPGAYYPEEACTYHPLKQRHSYSLDFKLSAIECYYQDSICKGNQRAVANKYNIHRRQVQKWLKQAEELRQKNEAVVHTQIVS